MRKLLISILIALLLLITIYSVVKGLSIGNIKILSFNDIKSESQNIDNKIAEITKAKEQTYKKTLSDIESNSKVLLQEKEKYASLVTTSTESEIEKATYAHKYEQDFLWAKIGNHATSQGVKLKFDIAVGAVNKQNYDLYFTVTGTYTNITEFVMALENDNLLGFKIENFKLVTEESAKTDKKDNTTNTSNTNTNTANKNNENNTNTANETTKKTSSNELQATFKVTDIAINIDKSMITTKPNTNTATVTGQTNATNTNTNKNVVSEGIEAE